MADNHLWTMAMRAAALMLALVSSASADCVSGLREPTQAEQQHYARAYAALKAALPVPPPSWMLSVDKDSGLDGLCNGDPAGQFEIPVHAFYKYQPSKEESAQADAERKKMRAETDALRERPPEVKRERHAPDPTRGSQITVGKVPSSRAGGLKLQGVRLVLEGPASRRVLIESAVDRKKLELLVN